jgi:hypothetical protein
MKLTILVMIMLLGTTGFAKQKGDQKRKPSQAVASGTVEIIPLRGQDGSVIGVGSLSIRDEAARMIYEALTSVKEEAGEGDRLTKKTFIKNGNKVACVHFVNKDGSNNYRCDTGPVNSTGGFDDPAN